MAGDALEPRTWIALYVATLATGALTIACISGAIAIAEGGMSLATLRQMFAMDGIVTVTNSSIAIAASMFPRSTSVRANSLTDHSPKSNRPDAMLFRTSR